jgi:hypothetical protein
MAKHAAKLVAANKMDHIVEVIQGSVEEIALPEKGEGLSSYLHKLEPDKCWSVWVYSCTVVAVTLQVFGQRMKEALPRLSVVPSEKTRIGMIAFAPSCLTHCGIKSPFYAVFLGGSRAPTLHV